MRGDSIGFPSLHHTLRRRGEETPSAGDDDIVLVGAIPVVHRLCTDEGPHGLAAVGITAELVERVGSIRPLVGPLDGTIPSAGLAAVAGEGGEAHVIRGQALVGLGLGSDDLLAGRLLGALLPVAAREGGEGEGGEGEGGEEGEAAEAAGVLALHGVSPPRRPAFHTEPFRALGGLSPRMRDWTLVLSLTNANYRVSKQIQNRWRRKRKK